MRSRVVLAGALVAGLGAGAPTGAAEPVAAGIEAYVAPYAEAGQLSGTLLVARGGEILFERSYGVADLAGGRPIETGTPIMVASITKPLTLILALDMIEEGLLALEDPLTQWIPGFPRGDEILVRNLLFHQSGLPHRLVDASQEHVRRSSVDMVELAAGADLLFAPGSRRLYSSAGYAVVARVLEIAGGRPYAELLAERVLDPAGAVDTVDASSDAAVSASLESYFPDSRGWQAAPGKDYAFLIGGGSLFAPPGDLWRVMRTLLDGGYGTRARANLVRFGNLEWGGNTNGFRAFADYHGETELAVIFAGNLHSGAIDRLRSAVPRLAAGEDVEASAPPEVREVEVPVADLERLTGRYAPEGGSPLELRVVGGRLRANDWILIPTAPRTFFSLQDYGTVEFLLDEDAQPRGLEWKTSAWSSTYSRLEASP